ncbi:substrate-binding domain-containing protein [Rhodococcus sp. IEGM 1379]|uniref:vWA domain-containing protein n=1 Tax=Rhodococcus sp. IEGM 1379 TaxID=3047086 RepID=UPI0024B74447|nr:substrate-binding domain-containing protein [Rhodococcus sp. IEGM 1379]MDI9919013.1 VWA domain-containing protein [Rhodococcus sp. IEGM 1379]
MGEHRGGSSARGISKGPIFVVVLIVLIVAGFFGWKALGSRIADQGEQAAGTCVEGGKTLDVTADPSIAPQIEELGKRYTLTSPVVRDHCITIAVHGAPTPAVGAALAAGAQSTWDASALGPRPGLWVAQSSFDTAPLAGQSVMNGEPRSLATSPLVLAVSPDTAAELKSAGAAWKSLPSELTMALPVGSTETVMATQAVAADVSGAGAGPVTTEQARSSPVTSALTTLALQFQTLPNPPATTADALAALSSGAQDNVKAVPTTEQSIAQSANPAMTAYSPIGATPVADYPAVVVSGAGIDETSSRAAAQFSEYMREAASSKIFVDSGFRVEGQGDPNLGALPLTRIASTLVPASAETAAVLGNVVANPVSVRSASIVMDTSTPMGVDDGGRSRLANIVTALEAQLGRSPDASDVGLAAFNTTERVLVPGAPLSAPDHRGALTAALNGLRAEGKSAKYPALAAAYKVAVDGYDSGRTNSVLLVTSSSTDESTMTRAELLSAIAAAGNASRSVHVDILVVGAGNDISTLQDVSDRTGGTLIRVDSTADPALAGAVAKLLS